MKEVGGVVQKLQRFISVLIPTNEHMGDLPGGQDTLPYTGQLTALYMEPGQELYLDSEDLSSAFNLFRVPETCRARTLRTLARCQDQLLVGPIWAWFGLP